MINEYYERELVRLKTYSRDFSKAYPSIAPMLGQPSSDPDVERLLEGVAYLTAIVHQRLDDEFPELIQEVARTLFPQFLAPIPSATIVAFSPKGKMAESVRVPKGTQVGSVPVDGTTCVFTTSQEVEVPPLRLEKVQVEQNTGKAAVIRLVFELSGPSLETWKLGNLRLFLGGGYAEASCLFHLLTQRLASIELSAPDLSPAVLPPSALSCPSFEDENALFPLSSSTSFSAYRLFQEYFVMPTKFFFVDIAGMDRWNVSGSGTTFSLAFRLSCPLPRPLPLGPGNFVLGASPAVNLFSIDADPIPMDHRFREHVIRPYALSPEHAEVYGVDSVTGTVLESGDQIAYLPFQSLMGRTLSPSERAYRTIQRPSPVGRRMETHLGLLYEPGEDPGEQTLSVRIRATNGSLPETLKPGEISRPLDTSPERLVFSNLTVPTAHIPPPFGEALYWRVLSQINTNFLSLADASRLRSLLGIYLFPMERNKTLEEANRRRLESIEEVHVSPESRLLRGVLMRGTRIAVRCRGDGFSDFYDLSLFAMILNEFLSVYASINTFIALEIEDTLTGERIACPQRMGNQPLI